MVISEMMYTQPSVSFQSPQVHLAGHLLVSNKPPKYCPILIEAGEGCCIAQVAMSPWMLMGSSVAPRGRAARKKRKVIIAFKFMEVPFTFR